MDNSLLRIFTQRNAAVLLLLGFASGLPLALTSGTLQAWMTVEGVDLKTIGFFSLVGQAYVFKFLWSPRWYSGLPLSSKVISRRCHCCHWLLCWYWRVN